MLSKKNPDDEKKKKGLITGILVGSAIGSVASLMLSTKKGRETSKSLAQKAVDEGKGFFGKIRKK